MNPTKFSINPVENYLRGSFPARKILFNFPSGQVSTS